MYKIAIIDGYVDEPTCLGVPPYISPYPRYIAGGIWQHNPKNRILYLTIDQIREKPALLKDVQYSDMVIIVTGMSVPGRYLSGFPLGPNETKKIMKKICHPLTVLTGPAAKYGYGVGGGKKTRRIEEYFDISIPGDPEIVINNLLENNLETSCVDLTRKRENAESIKKFAVKGSKITNQHPFFPRYLIAEIETYRGCPRAIYGGCSFCSEPSKGLPDFRPVEDVVAEVKNLYEQGARHFRIGNQPCIFSYHAEKVGKEEYPKPQPAVIEKLFKNIRRVAPDVKTLHIDNANPGVIANYPKESKTIAETIVKYHTSGDVAAFGVESVDPKVVEENNLKGNAKQIFEAIKILNEAGGKRGDNGLPELLPGINFVFGLKGETKDTYRQDYSFLEKILKNDLLIRRINIRQVVPIPGTKMFEVGTKIINKNKKYFKKFKRRVQKNIEKPLLKKLTPGGVVLKDVYLEKHRGKTTFGRQLGSYPLLVGIPGMYHLHEFIDVKIVDHGYRSITGVPYPLDLNKADMKTIKAIPRIGGKRARRVVRSRPIYSDKQVFEVLDDEMVAKRLLEYCCL
ncbi:MAG: radical SAM protein [Candidatus Thermoplasmatota archaeon]